MAQVKTQVPLLATVILALDEEGVEVGKQLLQLAQTLDPLARSRLRILRLATAPNGVVAAPLDLTEQGLTIARANPVFGTTSGVFAVPVSNADPQTFVRGSRPVAPSGDLLETALRITLQEAARTGGAEPLAQHGYRLVPNELAVYLVGRADATILAEVAQTTHAVTRSLGAQTDARRFALLMAAPTEDEANNPTITPTITPMYAPTTPYGTPDSARASLPDWRRRTMAQPWQQMLSWQQGEPPLLYVFLCEAWDEAGRYHQRPELRFAMAEALFGLFATGVMEHPQLKEALDLSTAAMDVNNGRERFGAIGTSRIAAPTVVMIDYLAHRLAADVLLRRGLLGEAAGMTLPDHRASVPAEARRDAERWVKDVFHARLHGAAHPLPKHLPPRIMETKTRGDWASLGISKASPEPTGLFWRWGRRQWGRFPLDSEAFWNLAVQNEVETAGESEYWTKRLAESYPAIEAELRLNLDDAVRHRTLGPEGVERAQAFANAVSTVLLAEQRRVDQELKQQEQQIALHHRHLEDELRRAHPRRGIPTFPTPPFSGRLPLLPRNMESVAHEVLDASFARVPMPLTVILVAVLVGLFGAQIVPEFARVLGPNQLPTAVFQALMGPTKHWFGALAMLAIFCLALLVPLARAFQLRRWQRRYAEERTLLWLARAREGDRFAESALINALIKQVERERSNILGWAHEIEEAAKELQRRAAEIADQTLAGPALARDLYLAKGDVWEGINPDDLYLRVRERQDEAAIIRNFLAYVQAHLGDVAQALRDGTIDTLALGFMRAVLQDTVTDEPFGSWSPEQAGETLDRARQAARVLLQPPLAGRPIGKFMALAIDPTVAWIDRLAAERGIVSVPLATPRWGLVIRFLTRTPLTLHDPAQRK